MGMAIAEKAMAAEQFNRRVTTSSTTTPTPFMGDGCLMEGISTKPAPGRHLGLGKLIAFWDDNGISIDGHVEAGSPTTPQAL